MFLATKLFVCTYVIDHANEVRPTNQMVLAKIKISKTKHIFNHKYLKQSLLWAVTVTGHSSTWAIYHKISIQFLSMRFPYFFLYLSIYNMYDHWNYHTNCPACVNLISFISKTNGFLFKTWTQSGQHFSHFYWRPIK